MHGDVMNAVADLRLGVGDVLGLQSAIDGPPGMPAVVGAEGAGGGDGDVDPAGVGGIEEDGVQAQPTRARLPERSGAVAAQAGEFLPVLAAVGRAEQGGVFHPGPDCIWIGERRLDVPHTLELPGVGRAVVPLVRAGNAIVDELVAGRFPGSAAIVGALDLLPGPTVGL